MGIDISKALILVAAPILALIIALYIHIVLFVFVLLLMVFIPIALFTFYCVARSTTHNTLFGDK